MVVIKSRRQKYLYFTSAVTFLGGMGSSFYLYLTAGKPSDDTMVFEYENSKMYTRSLKLAGGQVMVLADEFRRWFVGLWQGQNCAYTVAGITALASLLLFSVAYHLHSDEGASDRTTEGGDNTPR